MSQATQSVWPLAQAVGLVGGREGWGRGEGEHDASDGGGKGGIGTKGARGLNVSLSLCIWKDVHYSCRDRKSRGGARPSITHSLIHSP